jgi:hypothetical protein
MASIGYVDMPPCQKLGFIEIDLARHAAVLFAMLPNFPRIRNHFREAAGILSLFRAASGSVHESAKSEAGRHDACAKRRDPWGIQATIKDPSAVLILHWQTIYLCRIMWNRFHLCANAM